MKCVFQLHFEMLTWVSEQPTFCKIFIRDDHTEQCDTCWGQGWWVCCPASPRCPPPVSEFPPERVWSTPPQQAGPPHTGNPHWCSLLWYLKHAKIRSLNNSLHFSGFDTGEMQIFATACKMEFLNSYIPFTINYWSVCKLK